MSTKFIAGLMLTLLVVTLLGLGIQKVLRTDGEYALDQERQRLELDRLALETSARQAIITSPHYILVQAYGSYVLFFGVLGGLFFVAYTYRGRFERLVEWHSGDTQTQITQSKAEILAAERLEIARLEVQERVCELVKDMQSGRLQEVRQILSISTGKLQQALPEVSQAFSEHTYRMPSFSDILTSGMLTTKKMYIGQNVETQEPVFHTLRDKRPESIAVAGMSGSGKTTGVRFWLAAARHAGIYHQIYIADSHLYEPDLSLTASLGSFVQLPGVHTCQDMLELKDMVFAFFDEFEARKAGKLWTENAVMVLDEGIDIFSKYHGIKAKAKSVVTEGRKFGCSLVVVAQTQTNQSVPTEIRDNVAVKIAFGMERLQARTFLQDPEYAKIVSGIEKEGQAFYAPRFGDKFLVAVPYTSKDDMNLLSPQSTPVIDISHQTREIKQRSVMSEEKAREKLRELKASGLSWKDLASLLQYNNRSNLSQMVKTRHIPDEIRARLEGL